MYLRFWKYSLLGDSYSNCSKENLLQISTFFTAPRTNSGSLASSSASSTLMTKVSLLSCVLSIAASFSMSHDFHDNSFISAAFVLVRVLHLSRQVCGPTFFHVRISRMSVMLFFVVYCSFKMLLKVLFKIFPFLLWRQRDSPPLTVVRLLSSSSSSFAMPSVVTEE